MFDEISCNTATLVSFDKNEIVFSDILLGGKVPTRIIILLASFHDFTKGEKTWDDKLAHNA